MLGEDLHQRTVSGFSLSISTALALESLFTPRQAVYDPDRPRPPMVDLSVYQEFWVNVWTLFRNMMASATKEMIQTANPSLVADILEQEIDVIQSLFANEGRNQCLPRFYVPDYTDVAKGGNPLMVMRAETTPNQLIMKSLYTNAVKLLDRRSETLFNQKGLLRPPKKVPALILTHVPYDLLAHASFNRLDLLESNTGKLKSKREWNSKYHPVGKADLSHLPFLKTLLYILGDRVLLQPGPFKLREQIVQTAEKRHWTPATTLEKVIMDLEIEIKEPYVLQKIRAI